MLLYLIAVLTGVIITITPILNGQNTLQMGSLRTAFFHNFSAVFSGMLFLVILSPLTITQNFQMLPNASPINFLGGLIGLMVILLMNYYSVRIKAIYISLLPFLGQVFMGLILDYWVLGTFSVQKALGMAIVLIGIGVTNKKHSS